LPFSNYKEKYRYKCYGREREREREERRAVFCFCFACLRRRFGKPQHIAIITTVKNKLKYIGHVIFASNPRHDDAVGERKCRTDGDDVLFSCCSEGNVSR
jgi:hypothetical protein